MRYKESEAYLERAEQVIPLGSQTFSKSKTQFPFGASPYFIERGKGSKVWDIDGNQYLDFINGLTAVTLGYQDEDVDRAVRRQIENGVTFSLSHRLEAEVAELIVSMVPCAEMVRFGKNGSDATSGAIRLARAYTGRDHVVVCGYHGWHDWYIGSTTRNLGVPEVTKSLTHCFQYNDIASLQAVFDQFQGEVAAVIMEPMNSVLPVKGFLEEVKAIAHNNNALLIFDEMVTGFRFANGGAQAYFGVIPDLATLGKGLANGYPLSVVTGRKDIMRLMEDILYSFTYGGETLSLAASKAVLNKLLHHDVIENITAKGLEIVKGVKRVIHDLGMLDILSISGHPSWTFLNFNETGIYSQSVLKTYYMQEIFQRGILGFGTHNISYAHTREDIKALLDVYREVFRNLKYHIERKDLMKEIRCEVLTPLFSVRPQSKKSHKGEA